MERGETNHHTPTQHMTRTQEFYSPAALAFILANTTTITRPRKYTHVDTRTLLTITIR